MDFSTMLTAAPQSLNIIDSIRKARSVIGRHRKCVVSVSGGADSDVMLDLLKLVKQVPRIYFSLICKGLREIKPNLRATGEVEAGTFPYGCAICYAWFSK